jgi:hypothetical protein
MPAGMEPCRKPAVLENTRMRGWGAGCIQDTMAVTVAETRDVIRTSLIFLMARKDCTFMMAEVVGPVKCTGPMWETKEKTAGFCGLLVERGWWNPRWMCGWIRASGS